MFASLTAILDLYRVEYSTDIISQRRIDGHCASSPECFEHSLKNTKKDFF